MKVVLKGIGFKCKKCGFCCDAPTVTKKDLSKIAGYLNIPLNKVIKEYCKFFNGKIGELKEIKGKCIFYDFDNKKCLIYPVRPLICRFRPYSIQYKNGELIITYDIWFLRYCKGLYLGDNIDEESLKYANTVLKYLGIEKTVNEDEFKKRIEKLKNEQ